MGQKRLLCWLLAWAGLAAHCGAQSPKPRRFATEADLDQFIQSLFAVQDEDLNYEDAYEALFLLYANPLDLNQATREDLQSLYVLSGEQVGALLRHREQYGPLLSIYELQAVEGFDLPTIDKVLPFVEVRDRPLNADNSPLWQRLRREENNFLLLRYERTLEQRRGYRPLAPADTTSQGLPLTRYLGSPNKVYARFRTSHSRDFSFGFTVEKDAGEPLAWAPARRQHGPDFWSAHAAVYHRGRWKALLLGDYQLQVGQGLLLAAGFFVGKGAETVATVRRSTLGVRPYTSVLEGGFFRGGAATYALGRVEVTGFVSATRRSANLAQLAGDTLAAADEFAQSILPSGFHRTPRELAGKQQLPELTGGLTATYRSPNRQLELGGTLMATRFGAPLVPRDRVYNRFEFQGQANHNLGLHYGYHWRNIHLFGEVARSASGGVGLVSGVLANVSAKVELALLYRRFARDFHTFYGQAFSENTRNINEQGMYWGLKVRPNPRWQLTAYYDVFRFPWLKFLTDAPSDGREFLARLAYTPSKKVSLYAQYRQEVKGRNLRDNLTPMDLVVPGTRQNYQVNADFRADKVVSFRSRVQWSTYQQAGAGQTGGLVLVQDASLDFGRLRLSARFALFQTDDYENRQYVFEKDVLYAFSIPAYYGQGYRNYYLVQFRLSPRLDLWLRYAYTQYQRQAAISSGLEQIDGNRRSDVKVQLRWQVF
jgi:hypothetical protein